LPPSVRPSSILKKEQNIDYQEEENKLLMKNIYEPLSKVSILNKRKLLLLNPQQLKEFQSKGIFLSKTDQP
jgi:hypothetical protein